MPARRAATHRTAGLLGGSRQILVAYFLVIIIVIPVIVGLWWRNSSKFLEDGVMQSTAYRFYKQMQENQATKYIPGILASAVEFCEGAGCKNSQARF